MKKGFLAIAIVITFGCNNSKKENINDVTIKKEVIEVEKELIVKINFKTNKEDEFLLSLNDIIIDEFQKKNIRIIEKVLPNSSLETIVASFGENQISNNFRINFGNEYEKEIEIESMELSFGKNSIVLNSSELGQHFVFNKFIVQDSITNKLQTRKVDGKHYPAIALRRSAINILTKE